MDRFKPDSEEINYFVVALLATAAAYTTYSGTFTLENSLFFTAVAGLVLLTRELGQRTIAHFMKADTELHLSVKGSIVTIVGAVIAFLTQLPVILLFPVHNTFSVTSYEHWGREIDAMWSKREYQLVSGGILALLIGWFTSYILGYSTIAQAFALFALFQMLPFDYSKIPTGRLDGSIILRVNGFRWLIIFTAILIALALTV